MTVPRGLAALRIYANQPTHPIRPWQLNCQFSIVDSVLDVKALVGAFNQEKALVGAFSVIVHLHRLIDFRH